MLGLCPARDKGPVPAAISGKIVSSHVSSPSVGSPIAAGSPGHSLLPFASPERNQAPFSELAKAQRIQIKFSSPLMH